MNASRDELLISRVLDADAAASDWSELERMAEQDPTVWRDLGDSFRAEIAVRNAGEELLGSIRAVELPAAHASGYGNAQVSHAATRPQQATRSSHRGRIIGGAGWLAALVLLCAWLHASGATQTPKFEDDSLAPRRLGGELAVAGDAANGPANSAAPAVAVGVITFDDALSHYRTSGREEGRLVNELPMMVVDTQPQAGSDQLEVLYLRRFLERTTVDQVYELGTRDDGTAVAVPVQYTKLTDRGSL